MVDDDQTTKILDGLWTLGFHAGQRDMQERAAAKAVEDAAIWHDIKALPIKDQPVQLTTISQVEQPAAEGDVRELLAEKAYADGYEFFRNKWIGDHIEMNADLVEQFIPRPQLPHHPDTNRGK